MTPETRKQFTDDYLDGEIPVDVLKAKYNLDDYQYKTAVHIGTGSIIKPQPLGERKVKRVAQAVEGVLEKAGHHLQPGDFRVSPLQDQAQMTPESRMLATYLNETELQFANDVHMGRPSDHAAATAYELWNRQLAAKKARELLRTPHIRDYLNSMKGQTLMAPLCNRQYLEAVAMQIIHRSMAMSQEFDRGDGTIVQGSCTYDPKSALAAVALLARIKGYDGNNATLVVGETQVDRLRRLTANFNADKD